MKILVIGSGGREHALVWKITQSKKVRKVYCAPGNPGTGQIAQNVPINVTELDKLVRFARDKNIDLTVVGPEAPLINGIVDLFKENNLKIIGPTKIAAQIEGSKIFAKKLMEKYKIPTAKYKIFDDYKKASLFLRRLHLMGGATSLKYPIVIKADGQCFGKGVAVCGSFDQANKFLKLLMVDKIFGNCGSRVIIEECLEGQEVSFMLASDGKNFVSFIPSQDHKRAKDKDEGPNTGGMGAYAPVPFVDKNLFSKIEKEIAGPVIEAMRDENATYEGILYPGLILTPEGPKVLEFNCRFGDPETQPLMSMLKSDIIELFEAILNNKIRDYKFKWFSGASVCVVLTAKGYPGEYEKGKEISLARSHLARKYAVFHAGTKITNGKLVTSGGRVLGVTARGKNLKEAIKNVYKYIGKNGIHFSGMHYRKDIGKKGLNKNYVFNL